MLFLLQKDRLSFESHLESITGPTSVHYGHLISAASFLGWGEVVLKLLEKKAKCTEVIQIPYFKFPEDKTFEFFAYLDLEDIGRLQSVGGSLRVEGHPLDLLAKAYYEYLFGSLEAALECLDSLDKMVKLNEVLILRGQVLIELGKYQVIARSMKVLSQKQRDAMTWWAKHDILNLNQIVSKVPPNFQFAGQVHDSDYVVLLFDGMKFSPILLGAKDWLQSFTYLHSSKMGKAEDTPILLRARVPLKTVQSFRAVGRRD